MNETDIKSFLAEAEPEWHWNGDLTELYLVLHPRHLIDFCEMLNVDDFEGGIDASICHDGDICVEISTLLGNYGIVPKEIFNKPCWDSDEIFEPRQSYEFKVDKTLTYYITVNARDEETGRDIAEAMLEEDEGEYFDESVTRWSLA